MSVSTLGLTFLVCRMGRGELNAEGPFQSSASLSRSCGLRGSLSLRQLCLVSELCSASSVTRRAAGVSGVPRRQGSDAVTQSLPLLSLRPKPRASQSWTFGQGAVAPGFGSDGLLSHRGAYRGQQWAAPLTWPTLPLWGQRAWHWR